MELAPAAAFEVAFALPGPSGSGNLKALAGRAAVGPAAPLADARVATPQVRWAHVARLRLQVRSWRGPNQPEGPSPGRKSAPSLLIRGVAPGISRGLPQAAVETPRRHEHLDKTALLVYEMRNARSTESGEPCSQLGASLQGCSRCVEGSRLKSPFRTMIGQTW